MQTSAPETAAPASPCNSDSGSADSRNGDTVGASYGISGALAEAPRRGRSALIVLAVVIFLLFAAVTSQVAFNLTFLQPESTQQTFLFVALSAVVFLLFVALMFVLSRNLLKLYAERRLGVLGSAFRTRMVLGALVVSFLPVIFMFLFSYGLMNRSIDKWFSRPVEELREEAAKVASLLEDYAASNAAAEAESLAQSPAIHTAIAKGDFASASKVFARRGPSLQGGFAMLMRDGAVAASFGAPEGADAAVREMRSTRRITLGQRAYLAATATVDVHDQVLVAMLLPQTITETLQGIDQSERNYRELAGQRKAVRRVYMQLLMLLTALVLFAATWVSLFVARLVTRPVAALAEATQEISKGNLQYRVQTTAGDELGALITSFNRMAGDLETSQRQIETSRGELTEANVALSHANAALEQQRKEIEAVLENVPAGVASLNERGVMTHCNSALPPLMGREARAGETLAQLFGAEVAQELERLLRKADRMGRASREMQLETTRGQLQVEVTVASLQRQRQRAGYVVVIEDLSELLRAQRQTAWREVARRVAHEIKNPLTPISLSAERIRRHLDRAPDAASLAVIHGCAETISGAVETLRKLVDEFSLLARFPAAAPHPADLNAIVEGAISMFSERLDGIQMRLELQPGLPPVMADAEGIKRVVANLVDNAAEALQGSLIREIEVCTSYTAGRESAEIVVADSGHGVSREDKEKLFLPYFSTKDRGTGLGLAIVSRIVEEHGGSVRVEENKPLGSRFIVELPLAAQGVAETNG